MVLQPNFTIINYKLHAKIYYIVNICGVSIWLSASYSCVYIVCILPSLVTLLSIKEWIQPTHFEIGPSYFFSTTTIKVLCQYFRVGYINLYILFCSIRALLYNSRRHYISVSILIWLGLPLVLLASLTFILPNGCIHFSSLTSSSIGITFNFSPIYSFLLLCLKCISTSIIESQEVFSTSNIILEFHEQPLYHGE